MSVLKFQKAAVISLGGSILVPDAIDVRFLRAFRSLVLRFARRGFRFAIITGGGGVNRRYNAAARSITRVSNDDLDWIGIASTHLNAQLVRALFGTHAHPTLIGDPSRPPKTTKPILVGGGYVPGSSSDLDAVKIAQAWGVRTVVNLSDTPFVYDRDPKKHADAQPLTALSWAEYRRLIPKRWTPRLSTPFDPAASRLAERSGIRVCLVKGHATREIEKAIDSKSFAGTVIG